MSLRDFIENGCSARAEDKHAALNELLALESERTDALTAFGMMHEDRAAFRKRVDELEAENQRLIQARGHVGPHDLSPEDAERCLQCRMEADLAACARLVEAAIEMPVEVEGGCPLCERPYPDHQDDCPVGPFIQAVKAIPESTRQRLAEMMK